MALNCFGKWMRKLPKREALLGQLWRYCITGGLAFVVDFGLFGVFLYGVGVHYLLANLIGLFFGLAVNYAISVGWVFSACQRQFKEKKWLEVAVFVAVGICGVALNQGLMYLMVDLFMWQPMISKILAAGIVLMWNFGGRKCLLFRKRKESL